jgi:hypothetical protein
MHIHACAITTAHQVYLGLCTASLYYRLAMLRMLPSGSLNRKRLSCYRQHEYHPLVLRLAHHNAQTLNCWTISSISSPATHVTAVAWLVPAYYDLVNINSGVSSLKTISSWPLAPTCVRH